MTLDDAVERLVALGRQRGRLTTDDLRQLLPIEAMTASDIARIVGRLEDAGVAIDIDETLLARRPGAHPTARGGFEDTRPPEPAGSVAGAGAVTPTSPPHASRSAPPEPVARRSVPLYWIAIALAVLFVIVLFVFGLPGFR